MLRPLRIFPGTLGSDGKIKPIESGLPVEMLNRLKGKDGTPKSILGSYGRLMFSTGAGILLGLNIHTDDEYWSFVWEDEVKVEKQGDTVTKILHYPYGNSEPDEYSPASARAFKLWTPHPRRSGEADSPMRSVLEVAEELIALTQAVRSTATSRTVAGMLLMPNEMVPPPAEPGGDEDEESDPFVDEMLMHLETQIENAGSAAAASPWVIWGAYELLDKIRMVKLHDVANDYMERDLRTEAVQRMARGMDFPAEYLLGLSNANHWAAKQILDDMWRSHGAGVADQFVGDVNDAYLRRGLKDQDYPGWQDVVIGYDESQIVVPADQTKDAVEAYKLIEVSGKGLRTLMNIPEALAPSKAEREHREALQLKDAAALGLEPEGQPQPPQAPGPSDGPPPPGPEGDSGRETRVTAAVELGAAEMAVARCREMAGIKLMHKQKRHPEFFADMNGQQEGEIAASVGTEILGRISETALDLVRGGADPLTTVLQTWGYSSIQAKAVSQTVESYAARTLFKPGHQSLPSGFAAQFERAKEASNVG